jgi:hypothetical protein
MNQNLGKTWKDLKSGDAIYFVYNAGCKPKICKTTVKSVNIEQRGIKPYLFTVIVVKFLCSGIELGFVSEPERSVVKFGNSWYCSNLEEAKKQCMIIATRRLREVTRDLEQAKNRKKKWEEQINNFKQGIYNIK